MADQWNLFGPLMKAKKDIAQQRSQAEGRSLDRVKFGLSVEKFKLDKAKFDQANDPTSLGYQRKKAEDELALAQVKKKADFMAGQTEIFKNRTGDTDTHKFYDFVAYGQAHDDPQYVEWATNYIHTRQDELTKLGQYKAAADLGNRTVNPYKDFGPEQKYVPKNRDFVNTLSLNGDTFDVPPDIFAEEIKKIDPDDPDKTTKLHDALLSRLHKPDKRGNFIIPTRIKNDRDGGATAAMKSALEGALTAKVRAYYFTEDSIWSSGEKKQHWLDIEDIMRKLLKMEGIEFPPEKTKQKGLFISIREGLKNIPSESDFVAKVIQLASEYQEGSGDEEKPKGDTLNIQTLFDTDTGKYWKRDATGTKSEITKLEYEKLRKGK